MDSIERPEIVAAYRRAKADMHLQRGLPSAAAFADFELDFDNRIEAIRSRLNESETEFGFALGRTFLVPRAQAESIAANQDSDSVDPTLEKTTRRLVAPNPRRMFLPTVEFAVFSSVWMGRIGVHLDTLQSSRSFGNRLRMRKNVLHRQGSSFKPYIQNYVQWRDGALEAAASAAASGLPIQILTFDIQNFYGQVRGDFLLSEDFAKASGVNIAQLDPLRLTARLVSSMSSLSNDISPTGLPIGLPASAVIANAALYLADNKLASSPGTISYGRYVDDFIIVRHHQTSKAASIFQDALPEFMKTFGLTIAPGKTRTLEMSAEYAKVLLGELRVAFDHLSSEWRTLPTEHSLTNLSNLVVETRAGRRLSPQLRDADTIAAQRWTLSALLSRFSRYSSGLNRSEWAPQWSKIFARLAPIVLVAANLPGSIKHLREFVAITLLSGDEACIKSTGVRLRDACAMIRKTVNLDSSFDAFIRLTIDDAVVVAIGSRSPDALAAERTGNGYALLLESLDEDGKPVTIAPDHALNLCKRAFLGDFGLRPNWESILSEVLTSNGSLPGWISELPAVSSTKSHTADRLATILAAALTPAVPPTTSLNALAGWLMMGTRTPSASMLSLLAQKPYADWCTVVARLTGRLPRAPPIDTDTEFQSPFADWEKKRLSGLTIATGNIATSEDCFLRAAQGVPVASAERRNGLNLTFDRMNRHSRIDFCVTPELSIPRTFALDLARLVAERGTTSILGLEYQHVGDAGIRNSALVCFAGKGGQYWLRLQNKTSPAHVERVELWKAVNRAVSPNEPNIAKQVYNHRGVRFGVLICSELLNARHRLEFRGRIDLLFVPEWNRDLSHFESLTGAASVDIHCYIAQSNNRIYGDSLVRGPFKEEWMRVAVRVRGGLGDDFVGGRVDVTSLRRFQSRFVSPDAPFKPTPDGFVLDPRRRLLGTIKGD